MNTQNPILQIGKFSIHSPGGIESITKSIYESKEFSKMDTICFSKKNAGLSKNYREFKTNFIIKSQPFSASMILFLIRNSYKYKKIFLHYPNPLIALIVYLLIKRNQKLILFWHSDLIGNTFLHKISVYFEKLVLKKSHKVIFTSNEYLSNSNQSLNVFNKDVVIPLGIDDIEIDENYTFWGKNDLKIIFIGRLVQYKGLNEFLRLISNYKNIVIDVVGDGPLRDKLSTYKKKEDFMPKIYFHGELIEDKKHNLLKKSHFLVLPSISRAEAFGIVLIEALRLGKPVITNNLKGSGMIEVNSNFNGNPVGFKFNFDDKENIDEILKKIINLNEDEYMSICYNARKKFENNYTSELFLKNLSKALYE
tara:strand:+ start:941 stop:2035 length:1095 start_codon:yes stop_codon:yes gene_type:complete